MKAAPAPVARRFLLPEAEMLVGDLARTEGGGRWATFAAPPPLEESGDSHLAEAGTVTSLERGLGGSP